MNETREVYRPGQKVLALVDGVEQVVYLSLSTEEKGDRRDSCWRLAPPSNAIIPKGSKVEPIGIIPYDTPNAKKLSLHIHDSQK